MKKLIYCFDLDGTICTQGNFSYKEAEPIDVAVKAVNKLYDEGHTIIIDTARGGTSKIDWYDLTKEQLNKWGVKHHSLRVGQKIHADVYIDDKCVNAYDWRLLNA